MYKDRFALVGISDQHEFYSRLALTLGVSSPERTPQAGVSNEMSAALNSWAEGLPTGAILLGLADVLQHLGFGRDADVLLDATTDGRAPLSQTQVDVDHLLGRYGRVAAVATRLERRAAETGNIEERVRGARLHAESVRMRWGQAGAAALVASLFYGPWFFTEYWRCRWNLAKGTQLSSEAREAEREELARMATSILTQLYVRVQPYVQRIPALPVQRWEGAWAVPAR